MTYRRGPGERFVAEQIGRNVGHWLDSSPLSQAEIAMKAEVHRTHLRLILKGERLPQLDTVIRIAGALEVEPAELLRGVSWDATRQRFRTGCRR